MRNITGFLLSAAIMAAASLANPPGIASASDENLSFELVLDVGLVYGYQVGDFAIEGAVQDEGSAFGEFVTMPDGTQTFQLTLVGENTDWSLDIYDVQGQIGPGFSVIFSSDFFTLVGDAGTYAGVIGSGTASGYTYYSDGTSWGYPGNRQDWQLSGELIAPPPSPEPPPLPELAINDVSIVEGQRGSRNVYFTVSLSPASEEAVSVAYATADGTARESERDYYGTSGVLTIQPGDSSATIGVKVRGDHKREPDETFFVYLGSPIGAVLVDDEGIGTILNDD